MFAEVPKRTAKGCNEPLEATMDCTTHSGGRIPATVIILDLIIELHLGRKIAIGVGMDRYLFVSSSMGLEGLQQVDSKELFFVKASSSILHSLGKS